MERREFVKVSALAAGAMAMPNILKAGSKEKVRMGFIGVGNRGTQLLHIFMKNPKVEVTALADIYEPNLRRDDAAFDPKFLERGLKGRLPNFRNKDGSLKKQEVELAVRIKNSTCRLYSDYKALLDDGSAESATKNVIGDFVDRCLDRNPEVLCSIEEGHRSTCFAHLANIAYKLGKRFEWDGDAERFTNCEEANRLLHYTYRDGYGLG